MARTRTATLHLDADSHISFSASETRRVPTSGTIRFRLGTPRASGSIPIAVRPEDVSIAPIPVAQGAAIAYALAEPATGASPTPRSGSSGVIDRLIFAIQQGDFTSGASCDFKSGPAWVLVAHDSALFRAGVIPLYVCDALNVLRSLRLSNPERGDAKVEN